VSETTLDRIVADVRRRLDTYTEAPGLEDAAFEAVEARRREGLRSLGRALSNPGPALIAECKKASPSAGLICEDFDAAALAGAYSAGGAAAISVVTEPDSFQGDTRWLIDVRRTVDLPVLRKDFIVTRRQLFETAVLGVDAVLLIARILDQETLSSLLQTATGDRGGIRGADCRRQRTRPRDLRGATRPGGIDGGRAAGRSGPDCRERDPWSRRSRPLARRRIRRFPGGGASGEVGGPGGSSAKPSWEESALTGGAWHPDSPQRAAGAGVPFRESACLASSRGQRLGLGHGNGDRHG